MKTMKGLFFLSTGADTVPTLSAMTVSPRFFAKNAKLRLSFIKIKMRVFGFAINV
jgi:hypothetical protein